MNESEKDLEKKISFKELESEELDPVLDLFRDFSPGDIEILRSIDSRKGNHQGGESKLKRLARLENFRKGPERIKRLLEDPVRRKKWVEGSFNSSEAKEKSRSTREAWTDEDKWSHLKASFLSEASMRLAYENRKWMYSDIEWQRAQLRRRSEGIRRYWTSITRKERTQFGDKVSIGQRRYWDSLSKEGKEERNRINSEAQTGKILDSVVRRKIGEGSKKRWLSLTEEEKEGLLRSSFHSDKAVKNRVKALNMKPNELERRVGRKLEGKFPREWKYNGDFSQGIMIGRRIPDFVNVDGRKEVVSVMGCLGLAHFLGDEEEEIEHYAKYGYKCHIIWEWDAWDPQVLDSILIRIGERQ